MFKKLISILASTFLILGCTTTLPWEGLEPNESYSIAECNKDNQWICDDFTIDKVSGFGLVSVFSWTDTNMEKFHLLGIDTDFDGKCNSVGVVRETGEKARPDGDIHPVVTGVNVILCKDRDAFIETVKLVLKKYRKKV